MPVNLCETTTTRFISVFTIVQITLPFANSDHSVSVYSQVHYAISPDFFGEYQNYTFLETLLYKQSEKQCFHLLQDLFGRHLGFYKMAAVKRFSSISQLLNNLEIWFWQLNHHFHVEELEALKGPHIFFWKGPAVLNPALLHVEFLLLLTCWGVSTSICSGVTGLYHPKQKELLVLQWIRGS